MNEIGNAFSDFMGCMLDEKIKEELETPEGRRNVSDLLMFSIAGFCEAVLNDKKANCFNHAQAKAIARMFATILSSKKQLAIVDKE